MRTSEPDARYCARHTEAGTEREKEQSRQRDERRGKTAERGYGSRWQRASKRFRARHPLCSACMDRGKIQQGTCVDHIQPITGPDDPLFWMESNWQTLCDDCHREKTKAEGRTSEVRR